MRAVVPLFVCFFAAVVLASAAAPGSESRARLLLAGTDPVQLSGLGFAPSERVRLRVTTTLTRSKTVRASRTGRFSVAFAGVPLDRCNGLLAEARRPDGSVIRLKRPTPLCPPRG